MTQHTIVLFRNDLRLHDHPALYNAVRLGNIIPLFIWTHEDALKIGEAARWRLHKALQHLSDRLDQKGVPLIIRYGETTIDALKDVIRETDADALFYNNQTEPFLRQEDEHIKATFAHQLDIQTFSANLLFDPRSLRNQQQQPYQVFTPFYKKALSMMVEKALPEPQHISGYHQTIDRLSVDELDLLPVHPWYEKLEPLWAYGEDGAKEELRHFIKHKIATYHTKRDNIGKQGTSHLSHFLAQGEVSPRFIWQTIQHIMETYRDPSIRSGAESFLRELIWRDFSHHLMIHFPETRTQPLKNSFQTFPYLNKQEDIEAWKKGQTGYPIVDAGMRQLWETGWLPNRVRMIVASFLVKHLLVDWRIGADWFANTLVDYDLANNTMGWQWAAGSGADAAPYFRIFNPIRQGEKFDPSGTYVREWLPELADLPSSVIHKPWTATSNVLQTASITFGHVYPYPIIDHHFARNRALKAYEATKKA